MCQLYWRFHGYLVYVLSSLAHFLRFNVSDLITILFAVNIVVIWHCHVDFHYLGCLWTSPGCSELCLQQWNRLLYGMQDSWYLFLSNLQTSNLQGTIGMYICHPPAPCYLPLILELYKSSVSLSLWSRFWLLWVFFLYIVVTMLNTSSGSRGSLTMSWRTITRSSPPCLANAPPT